MKGRCRPVMIANQHTRVHTKPQEDSLRCFGPGDCGGKSTTAWSPQNPPWSPSSGGNPPRADPGSNPGRSMLISRSCLITAADEIQKSLVQKDPKLFQQDVFRHFYDGLLDISTLKKSINALLSLLSCCVASLTRLQAETLPVSTFRPLFVPGTRPKPGAGDTGLMPASK